MRRIEVDTTHFHGNAPGRCSVDARDGESSEWRALLPESRTQPHTRHFFESELRSVGRVTHLRLNIFPDGGVARLRAWGEPDVQQPDAAAVVRLNGMSRAEAIATLRSFCGSLRWAERMADARPFEHAAALFRMSDRAFWSMQEPDWLEAFSAHPRIGEKPAGKWTQEEQGGVQDQQREELARLNKDYFDKHGFVFITCATGKSGGEMLEELKRRLGSTRDEEIRTAAEEQSKILRLRVARWLEGR